LMLIVKQSLHVKSNKIPQTNDSPWCVAGWGGLVGLSELLQLHQQHTSAGVGGGGADTAGGGERVPCSICTRTFSNVYNLKVHVRDQHSGGGNVQCEVCGVFLKNPSTLRVHKSNYHVRCHTCGDYYRNTTALVEHQVAAHNLVATSVSAAVASVEKTNSSVGAGPINNNNMLRQFLQPTTFEDCIALDDSS